MTIDKTVKDNLNGKFKFKKLIRPQDVDPNNEEQVIDWLEQELRLARSLARGSSSPFNSNLAYRTFKEPYPIYD